MRNNSQVFAFLFMILLVLLAHQLFVWVDAVTRLLLKQ